MKKWILSVIGALALGIAFAYGVGARLPREHVATVRARFSTASRFDLSRAPGCERVPVLARRSRCRGARARSRWPPDLARTRVARRPRVRVHGLRPTHTPGQHDDHPRRRLQWTLDLSDPSRPERHRADHHGGRRGRQPVRPLHRVSCVGSTPAWKGCFAPSVPASARPRHRSASSSEPRATPRRAAPLRRALHPPPRRVRHF